MSIERTASKSDGWLTAARPGNPALWYDTRILLFRQLRAGQNHIRRELTGPTQTVPRILLSVILQHILTQQLSLSQYPQVLEDYSLRDIKSDFPIRPSTAIQRIQELLNLFFRLNTLFNLATGELDLIAEIGEFRLDYGLKRDEFNRRRCVRGADGKDTGYEFRMPKGDTIDNCSSLATSSNLPFFLYQTRIFSTSAYPIMSPQNNPFSPQLPRQLFDIIGRPLEAIKRQ